MRFDTESEKCGYVVFSRQQQPGVTIRFGGKTLRQKLSHKCLGVTLDAGLRFSEHIAKVRAKAWRAYHDIRRVVGEGWGASTQAVIRLYEGLVRPTLEFASMVWDGASRAEKVSLERVHRLSLLAATGAHRRTSTVALEVYCNTETLQDRRDFLSSSFFHRIVRLEATQHPVAEAFRSWREHGSPAFRSCVSFFPRAAALCKRLLRFQTFTDGGLQFLEPIPDPPLEKGSKSARLRIRDKTAAKKTHLKFLRKLDPMRDVVVYTDGSAMPNPGKIGLGVSFSLGGASKVLSTPIGIGSILTAELCAINSALQWVLNTPKVLEYQRLFIFSDCQTAINLIYRRATPKGCFTLIQSIQEGMSRAREVIDTELLWVPAHVGVPGNEAANTAARDAAKSVQSNSPKPGQPPIPLATSRALLRVAFERRRQQLWLRTMAARSGTDHLSRLRADIARAPAFFVGRKREQAVLARLRLGQCGLNLSRSRWEPGVGEDCDCGARESVQHFLLRCPLYASERESMAKAVRAVWKHDITEEVLLGGGGVRMPDEAWELVALAVAAFVRCTGRKV